MWTGVFISIIVIFYCNVRQSICMYVYTYVNEHLRNWITCEECTYLSVHAYIVCWTGASVVPFPFPLLIQVSAQNWDHNDKFPQFNGPHATLPQGYQVLFQRLAEQLDVHYCTPVTRVEVTEEGRAESCRVTDSHGEVWLADKVSRSCFC